MKSKDNFLSYTEKRVTIADAFRDLVSTESTDRTFLNKVTKAMALSRLISADQAEEKLEARRQGGILLMQSTESAINTTKKLKA